MATNQGGHFFNESIHLAVNPDVVQLIAEGKDTSGLDYYTQIGQFKGDNETEDYAIQKVALELQIAYQDDLVAKVANAGDLTLQSFSFGDERPRILALGAPQNQFLTAG